MSHLAPAHWVPGLCGTSWKRAADCDLLVCSLCSRGHIETCSSPFGEVEGIFICLSEGCAGINYLMFVKHLEVDNC